MDKLFNCPLAGVPGPNIFNDKRIPMQGPKPSNDAFVIQYRLANENDVILRDILSSYYFKSKTTRNNGSGHFMSKIWAGITSARLSSE